MDLRGVSKEQQEKVDELYEYARDLLIDSGKGPLKVRSILIREGLEPKNATAVIQNIRGDIQAAKKRKSIKNIVIGSIIFLIGTLATLADMGYIFIGAIAVGIAQFFLGMLSYRKI